MQKKSREDSVILNKCDGRRKKKIKGYHFLLVNHNTQNYSKNKEKKKSRLVMTLYVKYLLS